MDERYFAYQLNARVPIKCTMAGIRRTNKPFGHVRRALPDFASFLMLKGSFGVFDEVKSNQENDLMEEGDIHTIAPGFYQETKKKLGAGHSFLWFHFWQDCPFKIVSLHETKKILEEQFAKNEPQNYLMIPRHFSLKTIMLEMMQSHGQLIENISTWGIRDFGSDLATNQLLYLQHRYLLKFFELKSEGANRKRDHVRRAQIRINDCFQDIESVQDVAKILELNPSYLSRCFKEYTGETIIHYIQKTKINAAFQMIKQGRHNIKKVAFDVGFHDLNYFCRVFKKITGLTTNEAKKI